MSLTRVREVHSLHLTVHVGQDLLQESCYVSLPKQVVCATGRKEDDWE